MKKVFRLSFLLLFLCFQKSISQGFITAADNSVNAINASSGVIPKTEPSTAMWTATNAYWATPLIYRTRRFPDDGTGAFPFNNYGELMIQGTSHGSMYNKGISFLTWDGSGAEPQIRMRVSPEGNIGIGTLSPDAKLTVNGKIRSREVKVDLNFPAPDYVFAPDYKLRSLQEVENYIKENSHLPEIPSAKEFEKNGINVSEMNMALLKKVEELTLYTIEQQKNTEVLMKIIEQQNRRLEVLENCK